ncbi:MAG: uracil-DNA glycosylase family protein [Promethearchaeota archaeon]
MPGFGPDRPKILFTGEAPGMHEDEQGRPFVGKAGQWLNSAIEALELQPDEYRLTNVVRCRPLDNRTPRAKEIRLCSQFLVDEIAECEPNVVVLLGNVPLKAVLGESGITTWNGVVVERNGITYVPAFHPSFFNYGNQDRLEEWIAALGKAVEVVDGKATNTTADADWDYEFPKTLADIDAMVDEIAEFDGPVSYDVEAQWLEPDRPGNKILSFSLGIDGVAWSVQLDHKDSHWTEDERDTVARKLCVILATTRVLGHNVRFDCKSTRRLLGIDFQPAEDTMLINQLLDSRKGIHGLKRLAGLHLGMFDYDKELQDYVAEHDDCNYAKGGHYGNVPLDVLLPYGGKDAAATWLLHHKLYPELAEVQRILYHQLIIQADYELGIMEGNGFKLDKRLCRRYRAIYEMVRDKYYTKLLEDPAVKQYINIRQTGKMSMKV